MNVLNERTNGGLISVVGHRYVVLSRPAVDSRSIRIDALEHRRRPPPLLRLRFRDAHNAPFAVARKGMRMLVTFS